MRRLIAIVSTLVVAALLAPAPTAEAGLVNSLTVTGRMTFWDDYTCRPGSGTSCAGTANPVELWAPWAPACGVGTCPTPDVFDWVLESDQDVAGQHACTGYAAPSTLRVRLSPDSQCSLFAVGAMTSGSFFAGPWCGYGAGDFLEPAQVTIGNQTWEMIFTLPFSLHHTGPTFVYELSPAAQSHRTVGAMEITVVGANGSCGLGPDFQPATSYDVVAELNWID